VFSLEFLPVGFKSSPNLSEVTKAFKPSLKLAVSVKVLVPVDNALLLGFHLLPKEFCSLLK